MKPERLALEWASAAEAPLYVSLITKFTNQMKEMGPLGEAEGIPIEDLKSKLLASKSVVENLRIRTRVGKLTQQLREEGGYTPELIKAKMSEKINEMIEKELEKQEKKITESAA